MPLLGANTPSPQPRLPTHVIWHIVPDDYRVKHMNAKHQTNTSNDNPLPKRPFNLLQEFRVTINPPWQGPFEKCQTFTSVRHATRVMWRRWQRAKKKKGRRSSSSLHSSQIFFLFFFFGCGRQEFVVEAQLHRQTFDFESKTKPKCYVWSGVKSTFCPTSEGYFVICGADGACLFCFEPHQDGGQWASMWAMRGEEKKAAHNF